MQLQKDVYTFVRVCNLRGKMSKSSECWGEGEEFVGRQGRRHGGGEGLK